MKYTRKFLFCVQVAQISCVSGEIWVVSARNVRFRRQTGPAGAAAPMVTKRKQFPNRVVTGTAAARCCPDDAPLRAPQPCPHRQGSFCCVARIYSLHRIYVFHPFGGAAQSGSLCGMLPHCRFSAVKQIFHFGKKCAMTAHNGHFVRQTKQSCTKKQAWKWHFCLLPAFWGTVIIEEKKYLFIS